jgi:hypothetical protein
MTIATVSQYASTKAISMKGLSKWPSWATHIVNVRKFASGSGACRVNVVLSKVHGELIVCWKIRRRL